MWAAAFCTPFFPWLYGLAMGGGQQEGTGIGL